MLNWQMFGGDVANDDVEDTIGMHSWISKADCVKMSIHISTYGLELFWWLLQ